MLQFQTRRGRLGGLPQRLNDEGQEESIRCERIICEASHQILQEKGVPWFQVAETRESRFVICEQLGPGPRNSCYNIRDFMCAFTTVASMFEIL